MTAIAKVHRFQPAQRVRFVGGEGLVRKLKIETGTWKYLVEMPLGDEPSFGRVGPETMILLNETELRAA